MVGHTVSLSCALRSYKRALGPLWREESGARRGQLPGEAGMEDDHTGEKKQQFQGDKGQPERI